MAQTGVYFFDLNILLVEKEQDLNEANVLLAESNPDSSLVFICFVCLPVNVNVILMHRFISSIIIYFETTLLPAVVLVWK